MECPAYLSKYNSTREKHCQYLAVKKLSALLKGKKSKHDVDLYYLNCLHSYITKISLNLMRKYIKIKIFVKF